MIERPATHSKELADETGELYLGNLNLEWNDLRGKTVLDIGAQSAEFENAARRRDVDVVSVDREISAYPEYRPPKDSKFVLAEARQLPFKDASFDFVLAHMSVMNYLGQNAISEVTDVFREIFRVLKFGGEFRFTNTALDEDELRQGVVDIVPPQSSKEYHAWREEREHQVLRKIAQDVGYRELRLEQRDEARHPYPEGYSNVGYHYVAIK